MKTIKKVLLVFLVAVFGITSVSAATVEPKAEPEVLCYSQVGYLGSAAYQAHATFQGQYYSYGGYIFEVANCTVTHNSRSATSTSVTCYGTLYAPSNYGVSVYRTVYGY